MTAAPQRVLIGVDGPLLGSQKHYRDEFPFNISQLSPDSRLRLKGSPEILQLRLQPHIPLDQYEEALTSLNKVNLALFGCNAFLEAFDNITPLPSKQLKKLLKHQQRPQLEDLIAKIKASPGGHVDDPFLKALKSSGAWIHDLLQLASQL